MYILHVLVLIALQPHRNPAERAAAPATDLCFKVEDDDGGQRGGKEIPLLEIMSDVGSSHATTGQSITDTPQLSYAAAAPHRDDHPAPMLGTHVKDVVSIEIVGPVQPAKFDTVLQEQRKFQHHDNISRDQTNSTLATKFLPPDHQIARSEVHTVAQRDTWADDTDL
ncbi:Hypothetical protein, putative [Bodo saltans]|uniref:Membrane-associated protein n=1 Tax=Bodo saltans TaxID=75058 RepID=A0A0S4JFY1_BODSA|nr:Hypothetical protein, putative [Bodo saltans]|eukprot:CUG89043.1 Hypothetical protein, putative [Bodo saltans]